MTSHSHIGHMLVNQSYRIFSWFGSWCVWIVNIGIHCFVEFLDDSVGYPEAYENPEMEISMVPILFIYVSDCQCVTVCQFSRIEVGLSGMLWT